MHYKLVFRIIAALLLIVAFFMVFPIAFALHFREFDLVPSFLIPMGIVGGFPPGLHHMQEPGEKGRYPGWFSACNRKLAGGFLNQRFAVLSVRLDTKIYGCLV